MRQLITALACSVSLSAFAEPLIVEINQVSADGIGNSLGLVSIETSPYGLVFSPNLQGLASGLHGFHIHMNPSCEAAEKAGAASAAEGAGGHWDPKATGQHGAPWNNQAHLGDLPALYVDAEGRAQQAVLAPRLNSLEEIKGRALMLHAGGDNHADHPAPLGGGGARIACGVIR